MPRNVENGEANTHRGGKFAPAKLNFLKLQVNTALLADNTEKTSASCSRKELLKHSHRTTIHSSTNSWVIDSLENHVDQTFALFTITA